MSQTTPWYKNSLIWAWLLPFLGIAGALVYYLAIGEPKSREMQAQLEAEFHLVVPLPQSTLLDYQAFHKLEHALVSGGYSTQLSYDEIRKHYDDELAKRGWKFFSEEKLSDWGDDLGGKMVCYHKGELVAAFQYAGDPKYYGWTYGLAFSWGLSTCK